MLMTLAPAVFIIPTAVIMAEVITVMPKATMVILAAGLAWYLVILDLVGKALPYGNTPLKKTAI